MSVSIKSAKFEAYNMWLQLRDGRALGVPLAYFSALASASADRKYRVFLGCRQLTD